MKRILSLAAILTLSSCSQKEEERSYRGERVSVNREENSPGSVKDGDAIVQTSNRPTSEVLVDRPVVTAEKQLVLSLQAEVDLSALTPNLFDGLLAVHQIEGGKSVMFGKNSLSWQFDSTQAGRLKPLSSDFLFSKDSVVYVMDSGRFWLFEAGNIAFPSSQSSGTQGQVTLFNIVPELLKNPDVKPKTLFVGPRHVILAEGKRANIVVLDGDKANVISFDFPTQVGASVTPDIKYAGLGSTDNLYWFASSDQLFVLKKNAQGSYSWVVTPFRIDTTGDLAAAKLSMVLELKGEKEFVYVGQPLLYTGNKIYAVNSLKLTVPTAQEAAVTAAFTAQVMPLLTNNCVKCHEGYNTEESARLKSVGFKTHLMNKTMPPGAPLSDADTKVILDWYASIPL